MFRYLARTVLPGAHTPGLPVDILSRSFTPFSVCIEKKYTISLPRIEHNVRNGQRSPSIVEGR